MWVNRVPEPVTVKQRVHLDVHAASTDEVLARGATPQDMESFRWDVPARPRGRRALRVRRATRCRPTSSTRSSSTAPTRHAIASWWAEVLGATVQHDGDEGSSWFEDAPQRAVRLLRLRDGPEPKTVKNRIHWDVEADDVQALLDHGAAVLREPDDVISWHVLADPEGNEFCAFLPGSDAGRRE